MTRTADVPADTDILCEHCGYGLNGLPTDGLCPECGRPIADSTTGDGRVPPLWEVPKTSFARRFAGTTARILLSPTNFFRTLQTRPQQDRSVAFANWHHALDAILLGLTATIHTYSMGQLDGLPGRSAAVPYYVAPAMIGLTLLVLSSITRLASKLTQVEGRYWGYRLPPGTVRRAMNYHAAQLLPVSLVALTTVIGYQLLVFTRALSHLHDVQYLYVICGEVVIGAFYLFRTYWIAMKNIMFANQ